MKIVLTLCEMFLAFCYFWMLFRGSVKINGVECHNFFVRGIAALLGTLFIGVFVCLPIIGLTALITMIWKNTTHLQERKQKHEKDYG